MEEFTIIDRKTDGVVILDIEGYLDAHTSSVLEKAFENLINGNIFRIIVNFKKLSYISSAGLGVFMAYIETIRKNDGDIILCEMNDKIFNIFEMLGFPVLFEILKNESDAISRFNKTKQ